MNHSQTQGNGKGPRAPGWLRGGQMSHRDWTSCGLHPAASLTRKHTGKPTHQWEAHTPARAHTHTHTHSWTSFFLRWQEARNTINTGNHTQSISACFYGDLASFFFLVVLINFHWSIVALQCCVSKSDLAICMSRRPGPWKAQREEMTAGLPVCRELCGAPTPGSFIAAGLGDENPIFR